jgi:hypothetical protein
LPGRVGAGPRVLGNSEGPSRPLRSPLHSFTAAQCALHARPGRLRSSGSRQEGLGIRTTVWTEWLSRTFATDCDRCHRGSRCLTRGCCRSPSTASRTCGAIPSRGVSSRLGLARERGRRTRDGSRGGEGQRWHRVRALIRAIAGLGNPLVVDSARSATGASASCATDMRVPSILRTISRSTAWSRVPPHEYLRRQARRPRSQPVYPATVFSARSRASPGSSPTARRTRL